MKTRAKRLYLHLEMSKITTIFVFIIQLYIADTKNNTERGVNCAQ